MVVGAKGREKGLPELSRTVKYNALQADIFILGNLYKHSLLEVRMFYSKSGSSLIL